MSPEQSLHGIILCIIERYVARKNTWCSKLAIINTVATYQKSKSTNREDQSREFVDVGKFVQWERRNRKERQCRREMKGKEHWSSTKTQPVPRMCTHNKASFSRFSTQPIEEYFKQLTPQLISYWKLLKGPDKINFANVMDTFIDTHISHTFSLIYYFKTPALKTSISHLK